MNDTDGDDNTKTTTMVITTITCYHVITNFLVHVHRRHPRHYQEPSEEWRWKHDQEQHQRLSYLLRLVDRVSEQIGNEVVLFADLLKYKENHIV